MIDNYVAMEAGATPRPSWSSEEDAMWECIGLDPGGTTGWALLRIYDEAMRSDEYRILDNVAYWSVGQIAGSLNHQIDELIDLVDAWPNAEVVCEDFILRTQVMSRGVLDPVRLTQPVDWWLASGGERAGDDEWKPRTIVLQQPSLGKSTITDERLQAMGAYHLTAGKPHGRDALRHALTWARRRKEQLTKEEGK